MTKQKVLIMPGLLKLNRASSIFSERQVLLKVAHSSERQASYVDGMQTGKCFNLHCKWYLQTHDNSVKTLEAKNKSIQNRF